jgi:hypothetical protein
MPHLNTVAPAHRPAAGRVYNRAALNLGELDMATGNAPAQAAALVVCPGRGALRRVRYG